MTDDQNPPDDQDGDDKEDFADKTSIMQSDTFKLRIAEAGQAPPSMVLLVGPASSIGRQWPLEDTDRVIGRSPNSAIYVDDKSVSKSHAKILLEGGDVSVMDLESTNKTVVNGQVIPPLTDQAEKQRSDQTWKHYFQVPRKGKPRNRGFWQPLLIEVKLMPSRELQTGEL